MIETPALWVAVAGMLPLMAIASYMDLKYLKIPNWVCVAVLALFVVTGLWGLPLDTFFWRLGHGAVFLVLGFLLFMTGAIGGGDAKMAAAVTPFVVPYDLAHFLLLYSALSFLTLGLLLLLRRMNKGRQTGWMSIDEDISEGRKRPFPMGLLFGLTMMVYIANAAFNII